MRGDTRRALAIVSFSIALIAGIYTQTTDLGVPAPPMRVYGHVYEDSSPVCGVDVGFVEEGGETRASVETLCEDSEAPQDYKESLDKAGFYDTEWDGYIQGGSGDSFGIFVNDWFSGININYKEGASERVDIHNFGSDFAEVGITEYPSSVEIGEEAPVDAEIGTNVNVDLVATFDGNVVGEQSGMYPLTYQYGSNDFGKETARTIFYLSPDKYSTGSHIFKIEAKKNGNIIGSDSVTISVSEPAETYQISKSATNGSITLSPSQSEYEEGTSIKATANPDSGYEFDSWSDYLSDSNNPHSFSMPSHDITISANFAEVETYQISKSATNGSITLSPSQSEYEEGTSIKATANPDSGYEFDSWGGNLSGSDNPYYFLMPSYDATISAGFSEEGVAGEDTTEEEEQVETISETEYEEPEESVETVKLFGEIVDEDGHTLKNSKMTFDGETEVLEDGKYSYEVPVYSTHTIKTEKEGYETYRGSVSMGNRDFEVTVKLKKRDVGMKILEKAPTKEAGGWPIEELLLVLFILGWLTVIGYEIYCISGW